MLTRKEEPELWRDFILQHLPLAYSRATPEQCRAIITELRAIVSDSDSPIRGTALLALAQLAWQPGAPSDLRKEVSAHVRQAILGGGNDSAEYLAAAISVVRRLRIKELLPHLHAIATDAHRPARLRIAACAALAQFGGSSEASLLCRLSHDPDERIRRSATRFLEQLRSSPSGAEK